MKIHNIKILEEFADAVLTKEKTFEIRYNDRDYQVGDIIVFDVVDTSEKLREHALNNIVWKITYILNLNDDFKGLEDGYVGMSIKELTAFEVLQIVENGNINNKS